MNTKCILTARPRYSSCLLPGLLCDPYTLESQSVGCCSDRWGLHTSKVVSHSSRKTGSASCMQELPLFHLEILPLLDIDLYIGNVLEAVPFAQPNRTAADDVLKSLCFPF